MNSDPPHGTLLSATAWVLLLGACVEPNYGFEPFLCHQTGRCPAGYRCVDGVCRQGSSSTPSDGVARTDHLRLDGARNAAVDGRRPLPDLAPPDAAPPDVAPPDVTPPPDAKPPEPDAWSPPGTWKALNKGSFQMGSPTGEPCRDSDEPRHKVTLSRGFWIMNTEVTRVMFKGVMGYLPPGLTGCASCPVTLVTWHEAAAYCNALSQKVGLKACYSCSGTKASASCTAVHTGAKIYACPGYRLPTEAEWEYACRAGTTTALHNGPLTGCTVFTSQADAIAWFGNNSGAKPHPVGKKKANKWGLHDMSGNAAEWCHDRYSSNIGKTVTDPVETTGPNACSRGGSFGSWPRYIRSANRSAFAPGTSSSYIGLRCVRTRP